MNTDEGIDRAKARTKAKAPKRGNGEGSITKLPGGAGWEARGAVSGQRRKFRAPTKVAALHRLQEARQAAAEGVPLADARVTVGRVLDGWLADLEHGGRVKPSSRDTYQRTVRLWIRPHVGHVRVVELTPAHVNAMLRALATAGKSPATQRMARTTLGRAMRWATRQGVAARNVVPLTDGPRLSSQAGRTLTPDEARRLVAAVEGERWGCTAVVALALGLRRGELLGLMWEDVELDAAPPLVAIRRQVQRVPREGLVVLPTKTSTERVVPLPGFVVEALRKHRARQAAMRLAAGPAWTERGFVFTDVIGGPIDGRNFSRWLGEMGTRAGIENLHPHLLRHSAASLLLTQGVPLIVVSRMLGHAGIEITANVYAHLLPEVSAQTAAAMDAVMFGKDEVAAVSP